MDLQDQATVILRHVRAIYNDENSLKSSNKTRSNRGTEDVMTRIVVTRHIRCLENKLQQYFIARNLLNTALLVRRAMATPVRNCEELSLLALDYGINRFGLKAVMLGLQSPGDHVVVAFGNDVTRINGEVTMQELAGFDIIICDVWANFCARPGEYDDRFIEKMHTWYQKSKDVIFNGWWVSPVNIEWLCTIVEGKWTVSRL